MQSMSSALDRISEFAFKDAAKQKALEGEMWAYNNPVTPQQLEQARNGALDIANTQPAAGTYFGDAARKAQAGQLRGQLELQARSEIAKISAAVDTGAVTNTKDLDIAFRGIADGYSKVIAGLDVDQANAFRASVATASKAVYDSALKKISDVYVEAKKENVRQANKDVGVVLFETIRNASDPVELNKRIDIERNNVLSSAAEVLDAPFFNEQRNEFSKNLESAYVNAITDYVTGEELRRDTGARSDVQLMREVDQGILGRYSSIYRGLKPEMQEKVRDGIATRIAKNAQREREGAEQSKKVAHEEGMQLRLDYYNGKIKKDDLVLELMKRSDIGREELEDLKKPKGQGDGSEQHFGRLESMVDRGMIGEVGIDAEAKSGRISWKQANGLKRNARQQKPEMSAAKSFIDNALGVPDPLTPGFRRERQQAAQAKNELLLREEQARQDGKLFNPLKEAQDIVKGTKDTNSDQIRKDDEEALRDSLKDSGLTYRTDYTDESLKRAGVSNADKRKRILRRQRAVTGE
jgi:hypothetical protein